MARTLTGVVSSDKRDKTITVMITSRETHPLYRKQFTITRKYTAHDANNEAHEHCNDRRIAPNQQDQDLDSR